MNETGYNKTVIEQTDTMEQTHFKGLKVVEEVKKFATFYGP
jgi:hypothetical protein